MTNFWTDTLEPPVDAASGAMVEWLTGVAAAVEPKPYVGGGKGATRRLTVPADQPLVPVHMPHPHTAAQAFLDALGGLPIPPDAVPSTAGGNDSDLLIMQPMPDGRVRCFEVWHAAPQPDGSWTAKAIGATPDYAATLARGAFSDDEWPPLTSVKTHGHVMQNGISASGMPIAAGQIQAAPLLAAQAAGDPTVAIPNAMALCVPDVRGDVVCSPATRSDGTLGFPAIPYGAKMRLDWGFEPWPDASFGELCVLHAAKTKGIVMRERTHSVVSITAEGTDDGVVPSILGRDVLHRFPWDQLQVLPMALAPTGRKVLAA